MANRLISYRHTLINSIGTFFSRVTGILKNPLISYLFGASADPFVLAFRITNTLRRYIGEGAFSNAFIPVYKKKLDSDSKESSALFANNVLNLFLILSTLLTVAGILLAPFYYPPLVPGFKKGTVELKQSIIMIMIMMPFTIFIFLFSLGMGILNSHKRFSTPAFAPVLFNIMFVLSPLVLGRKIGVYSLAVGVAAGGLGMFLFELIELYKIKFKYKFYLNLKDESLKSFFNLFIPTSINMAVLTVKNLTTTIFLSFFKGASIVFFNIITIIEAPLGIIGIAIGTVLLPLLSRFNAKKENENFEKALTESFTLLFYFIIPVALFFIIYPDTIVNVTFRDTMRLLTGNTGKYGELLQKTYTANSLYSIALFPMSCTVIFERIFYSIHNAKIPLRANIVVFIFSFVFYFSSLIPSIGFYGVFLGDVIASWMIFVFYLIQLRKIIKVRPLYKKLSLKIIEFFLISVIAVSIIYPYHRHVYLSALKPFTAILYGCLEFVLFSGIYYILTSIFKLDEIFKNKD